MIVGARRRDPPDHDPAGHGGRQSDDGADRNIEFAGDHDDRHARRHDEHDRHLAEQIADVRWRKEAVVGDLHDDDQDRQHAERLYQAVGAFEAREQARGARQAGRFRRRERRHAATALLHAGHLRPTVVGDAIARVLEHLGHDVVRAAHLGDWGTNFGMLIEHAIDIGEQATYDELAAGEFSAFYQAARAKFEGDPVFADRARKRVVQLQAGEPDTMRLWRLLVDDSLEYLRGIYARLNITLTDADMAPESFYNSMLGDVCDELESKGIAVMSDGALCAFPPGFSGRDGRPVPIMLRKSDGGYGYDSTDAAAIRYRLTQLGATRIIYVVGTEQHQHLEMIFELARQAGWLVPPATAEHAVIGLMTGPGGQRLRTRSGESVKLASLMDEAVDRAATVIADRYDDPAERSQIAEAVGIGALKYGDLSVARDSGYVLDFGRLLALTGNTGPYLQYAAARIRSIFAKAGLDPASVTGPIAAGTAAERGLSLRLLGFGRAVADAAATAEPHKLAGFLFEVASSFTTFYEQCPVLTAEGETRQSRLALSALTLRVLVTGLDLLGIAVPERM